MSEPWASYLNVMMGVSLAFLTSFLPASEMPCPCLLMGENCLAGLLESLGGSHAVLTASERGWDRLN